MDAPFFITVFKNFSGYFLDLGYKSLVKVTFGPIKTLSSTRRPSQSCTPLFIVTLLPITTSFSINTFAQILQFSPITAFSKTTHL